MLNNNQNQPQNPLINYAERARIILAKPFISEFASFASGFNIGADLYQGNYLSAMGRVGILSTFIFNAGYGQEPEIRVMRGFSALVSGAIGISNGFVAANQLNLPPSTLVASLNQTISASQLSNNSSAVARREF